MKVTANMLLLACDSDIYYRSLVLAVAGHYHLTPEGAERWLVLRARVLTARP
jgi:hypothetical protein